MGAPLFCCHARHGGLPAVASRAVRQFEAATLSGAVRRSIPQSIFFCRVTSPN
jgi:hypothetical protein